MSVKFFALPSISQCPVHYDTAIGAQAASVTVSVRPDIFASVSNLNVPKQCPGVTGAIALGDDSSGCGKTVSLSWKGPPSGSADLIIVGYGAGTGTAVVSSGFAAHHGFASNVASFGATYTIK
ncbi:unnamed protein product [Sympodiomycopsis kandeliae]